MRKWVFIIFPEDLKNVGTGFSHSRGIVSARTHTKKKTKKKPWEEGLLVEVFKEALK